MKGITQTLLFLLVIQMVATFFAFSGNSNLDTFTPEAPFLNVSLDTLDEIRIIPGKDEEQGDAITLKKTDGTWLLANHFNFPVSKAKLTDIQDKLLSIKKPYPVGTTDIAAKQFEVSDANFKTKVEFATNEATLETAFFGSSPSFKKVHARVAGETLTYSLPFSVFSIKGKPSTWIDREYLKIDTALITDISFPSFTLTREEKALTLQDQKDTETVATEAIAALAKMQWHLDLLRC